MPTIYEIGYQAATRQAQEIIYRKNAMYNEDEPISPKAVGSFLSEDDALKLTADRLKNRWISIPQDNALTVVGPIQNDDLDKRFAEIWERLNNNRNRTISYIHKCKNCQGDLLVPEHNGVFHCQYCGTCYVIDNAQITCTY